MGGACKVVLARGGWLALLAVLAVGCTRYGFSRTSSSIGDGGVAADAPGDGTSVTPPDGTAGNSDAVLADAPWPGFNLFTLKRFYRTSGTIAWLWQCAGVVPDFDRYELCVSTSATFPQSQTRCLTPLDDIALGDSACGGGDLWHPVTVYGLEAETTYFAQLSVYDANGERHLAPLVSDTTLPEPADRIEIFSEKLPAGVWLLELTLSQSAPHSGTYHLEHRATKTQWTNLHYGAIGPISAPKLTPDRFKAGFLELYMDAPAPVTVCVDLVGGGDVASFCLPRGFATLDGRTGYQRIQVPLAAFAWKDGTTLDPKTFGNWTKLQIGGSWSAGSVLLDDISIRY